MAEAAAGAGERPEIEMAGRDPDVAPLDESCKAVDCVAADRGAGPGSQQRG